MSYKTLLGLAKKTWCASLSLIFYLLHYIAREPQSTGKTLSIFFILHPISHTNWFSNLVCATFPTGAASWREFSSTIFFLIVETIFQYVPEFMVILQNLHAPSPASSRHWRACTTCDTSSIICLISAILSAGLDFLYLRPLPWSAIA